MATISNYVRWATNTEELKRNLKEGLDSIEATRAGAEKLVQSLAGDKLIAAAHRMAAAIQEVGGVTKLTAAEQERANVLIEKALEKYRVLGQQAPLALRQLAEATKKVPTDQLAVDTERLAKQFTATSTSAQAYVAAIQRIGGAAKLTEAEQKAVNAVLTEALAKYRALGQQAPPAMQALATATQKAANSGGSFSSMLSQANGLLGTFGIGLSVGAVVGFGKALLDDADALTKMSDKTGISIEGLQRLQVAGDDAGNSLDDLTGAVNMMQKRLGGGDASALGALKQLGLQFDDIKHLAPDQQFIAIADAVRQIKDPMQQVAIASDLFGKNAANVLPTIKRGFDDLKDTVPGMSAEAVKALDDTGDAITRLWRKTKGAIGEAAGQALRTIQGGDFEAPDVLGLAGRAAPPVRDIFPTGVGLGAAEEKAALEDLNDQLKKNQEAARKAREEAEKQLAAWNNLTTSVADLDGAIESEVRSWLAEGKSQSDIATAYGLTGGQVAAVAKQMAFEQSVADATTKAFGRQLAMMTPLTARFGNLHDSLHTLAGTWNEFHDGITIAGDTMATVTIPMFSTLPNVVPQGTKAIKDATAAAKSFGETLKMGFGRSLGGLNDVFMRAFEGGGGVLGAGKSLATSLTSAALAAIPAIGPIVSQFSGAIIAGVSKLFGGVSAEEKKGRDTIQAFEAQIASTLTTAQKAEAGGDSWKQTVIGVRDAYLKAGQSAAEAEAAVQKLWNASKLGAEATKAAIEEVNAVLQDQQQDEKDLEAAIQRYGFSLEQLGPAMQKQRLDEQAKQLLNDWRLLVGSGIAVTDVNSKMAGSINDYLKLARQTGQEVPASFKPILQTMIDNGTLTDDAGNAITDMGQLGVTWAESMTAGFDRVVNKLQQLLEGLGLVPKALDNIPTNTDIAIRPHYDDGTYAHAEPSYAARGGFVRALGVQHFDVGGWVKASGWREPWTIAKRGSDTVPAMLTPGELILNQGQQAQIASLLDKGAQAAQGILAAGKSGGAVLQETLNVTFTVNTVDASGFDEICEKQVMPRLTSMIEDRRRGFTSRWQQALGTT
jgi:hypothetical protein